LRLSSLAVCGVLLSACVSDDSLTLRPIDPSGLDPKTLKPGLTAFFAACDTLIGRDGRFIAPCEDADLAEVDPIEFLRAYFVAEVVQKGGKVGGFFTGYFEPEILASRTKAPGYTTPIYALPRDLVMVELGAFRDDLQGRRIAGRVDNGRLIPFSDRRAIETEGLDGTDVIAWAKDPVELFFLHIQGSGVLVFPDGETTRIGYAGQNGHIYTAIGRPLIARGEIASEDMSLEAIANWLRQHPDQAAQLMQENQSYVFFADRGAAGPFGSLGTALTARTAIAVDPKETPLGSLVYVEVPIPSEAAPFRVLLLAADTGGAINGLGRGDIFFGRGLEARAAASALKAPGQFIRFIPKPLPSARDPLS